MTKLTALFLLCLTTAPAISTEPVSFSINTKKWSHVLDDHFISITVNPTDLLQGKVYGLAMNSTMAILKGLAPAYVRIGSADTAKYTFKKTRHPSDMVKPEDEYTVTETHWMVFNEVAQSAGLDVIVCLNAAHRVEGTKKWDTRNSLELISFSDSQGYNLTWQLGYEVQSSDDVSGLQFGKDLNRLRTILNAFPRYQHAKLIGPDIRVIHKKEDIDFWNDVLIEAGPTLDAVTWHPRWPQPSKMKVSDNSDLGYEFPIDYLEWDKSQFNKILQKSIFKNPVWIGETKRESTGTFAEGLIWARRLVLAAKIGVEVVMKQPNLMDVSHPKPEYWIALLHKRLLGKSVLETRSVTNNTDLSVISHCTNPYYWSDKPEKLQDGPVTVYGVNMGGFEQKIQMKGTSTGKSQLLFQYVLTSGSDPDSVFSQMTYLNGEPLMMTDDGMLPDIIPKIKKIEKGLTMKLPPYSIGFWVVPEAKVKICQLPPHSIPTINIETLTPSAAKAPKNLQNIRDINQFLVEKLMNPESESDEVPEMKIEAASSESSEKEISLTPKENNLPRVARRIRQVPTDAFNQEIKTIMEETEEFLTKPEMVKEMSLKMKLPKGTPTMEQRIQTIAEGISDAIKSTNQEQEFNKFLDDSGLRKDFGQLLMNDRRNNAPGMPDFQTFQPMIGPMNAEMRQRFRRSVAESWEVSSSEESAENIKEKPKAVKFGKKISLAIDDEDEKEKNKKQDLVIPHQPDIKGLEKRYKAIVQSKLKEGKRKIDDMKRKMKHEEGDKKQPETVSDIQEEIIKKEIELLEKTEETVADILESQKKRQETFKDIIFDELDDAKDERRSALEEMHKNQKKKDNSIVKRQAPSSLPKPLMKTVEYIEKNFNLEPESVRKIKRSLEEKMGEMLRNYDTKKSLETKKRMASLREERKLNSRKAFAEEEEETADTKDVHKAAEDTRQNDKNFTRRTPSVSKSHITSQTSRKQDATPVKPKKSEEKKKQDDANDSFEMFNSKKLQEPPKKGERKRSSNDHQTEKAASKPVKKETKPFRKESEKFDKTNTENKTKHQEQEEEEEGKKERTEEKNQNDQNEEKKESKPEKTPLKNDKERRQAMLKEITNMVDHMNSLERSGDKSSGMMEDEGISEEFDSDRIPRKVKRRPRRAEMSEIESVASGQQVEPTAKEVVATTVVPVTSRAGKPRRHRVRPNRRLKELKKQQKGDVKKEEMKEEKKMDEMKEKMKMEEMKEEKMDEMKEKKKMDEMKEKMKMEEMKEEKKMDEMKEKMKMEEMKEEKKMDEMKEKKKMEEMKEEQKVEEKKEDAKPKKRHLIGVERPIPDLEKKKFLKPKGRKFLPKYFRHGNELTGNEKDEAMPEEIPSVEPFPVAQSITTQDTSPPMIIPKDELLKDLEEIAEEKVFLGQNSEISKEKFATNGGGSFERKDMEIDFSGETPTPTEGYIIVEPTIDMDTDDATTTEKVAATKNSKEKENTEGEDKTDEMVGMKHPGWKTYNKKMMEEESEEDKSETREVDNDKEMERSESSSEELGRNKVQKAEDAESIVRQKESQTDEDAKPKEIKAEVKELILPSLTTDEEAQKIGVDGNQRKRRATFLTNRGEDVEEEDEEDFSSEERIQKFKQMVYKNSPAKKMIKNEVRPSGGMGMGADEFLRMAGSTVRVMFDNVIPEAYGQTKMKIQNMGIPQYIKEFGKIVQQMKNLDQIFLNIGEAAVKGYIKGNRAEKGPYIQVISRKKRSLEEETTTMTDTPQRDAETTDEPMETAWATGSLESRDRPIDGKVEDASFDYATTGTGETRVADQSTNNRGGDRRGEDPTQNVWQNTESWAIGASDSEKTEATEATETKVPKNVLDDKLTTGMLQDTKPVTYPLENEISKAANTKKEDKDKMKFDEYYNLKETISPWIKTTKDFIRQALTTLQRQRQLSEILARETMEVDAMQKGIEKREVNAMQPKLPVYHMVPSGGNKKREANQKLSDESLIRQLRGLQPGVYVVPSEEMTNIRSEQITNEAKQKSGTPNVVTLNIYYDKKNPEAMGKADATAGEPMLSQDMVTYYQNNAWNAAASQYNQNNQYVSPVGIPEVGVNNPLVTPIVSPAAQSAPLYASEPRIAEIPSSRLIQYPVPAYHLPPVAKTFPSVVPNPQSIYGSMFYLPQENRFVPQPPGTKRQWREFKARNHGVPINANVNTGWNIQYETVPGSVRSSLKPLSATSFNKNFKAFPIDKKRSVGDFKMDPSWSEAALPFWKFFSTSSSDKKKEKTAEKESEEKAEDQSTETESSEDIFAENRKRAKQAVEKKPKKESVEDEEKEEETEVKEEEKVEKSRRRRSLREKKEDLGGEKKIKKRSYPYEVEFRDHDILPEWFGTYQEVENSLDQFPPHVRRSHIVSTSWSDEDDELLSILDADDELSLIDLDDDEYYYSNDNTIGHLNRYPRSTDQFDSNSIKTNMIYKMAVDSDHLKPKNLGMSGVKKLTDEDSSLEMVTKYKTVDDKSTSPGITKNPTTHQQQQVHTDMPEVKMVTQQSQQTSNGQTQQPQTGTGTGTQPRNPHDDTLFYFFKYAYDSLVKVMKSMTQYFN